jgi:Sulfotransferase family
MGDLAIDLAIYYQIGTARGDYSLLSSMNVSKPEFFVAFGNTINDLVLQHEVDLEKKRWRRAAGPSIPNEHFAMSSNAKARWVDGTPEYSFHICGLHKLFPEALFVHIFRDVRSVVRSMLHFHRVAGGTLVANQDEAYRYWLRTVRNCLLAERAYGWRAVFRLRHSDLVCAPEATLRSLLNFLGEPYAPECLEPLARRINSSNVPADFEIDDREANPTLIEEASRLCHEVEQTPQPLELSVNAIAEMEAAFDERVQYVATLASNYNKALKKIAILKDKEAKHRAQAEKLSKELKGKKSIIHRFRSRK